FVEPRPPRQTLGRAGGVELFGEVGGSGYKGGAAMVRRADGQMVKLGPLMYALLECIDGQRDGEQLTEALSRRIGRLVSTEQVEVLARKLAAVGLLAGTEHLAPPRRNPLLALRWKVLITNRTVTRWITAPFGFLFSPLVVWPVVAGFCVVLWYVLIDKGLASATAQAFDNPGLLLLVFALMVASAAFHELGHAAACRYGGATPGGMGVGIYLVWPAFYTNVTDAYRLPRRDRLRVDLGGLYFDAIVAVSSMLVWLLWRKDALLLVVALQILLMVKQLSPIIRADGYHILSDATGVPDLYAHIGPTLRALIPWRRREPSALTGWARVIVTAWVLILVPVMLSLLATGVLLLPRLATTAWDSGRQIAEAIPHQVHQGQMVSIGASVIRLAALLIPLVGSALITQKVVRSLVAKARAWSSGHLGRKLLCLLAAAAAVAGLAFAWWPSGQYQRITPHDHSTHGTIGDIPRLLAASPVRSVRSGTGPPPAAQTVPASGTRVAIAAIPAQGVTRADPAYFFLPATKHQAASAIVVSSTPGGHDRISSIPAAAFPFDLTSSISEGPHTHATAVNNANGGVVYEVAYSLVTVDGGRPVGETNSALAVAACQHCTTVAVSFQVVLVVGESKLIVPVDVAESLNRGCLACQTTAIADQIVVTLARHPTPQLLAELRADLARLGGLSSLGATGTPATIAAQVQSVQQAIDSQLSSSGLLSPPPTEPSTAPTSTAPSTGTSTNTSTSANTSSSTTTGSTPPTTTPATSSSATTTPPTSTPATTAPATTSSSTTTTSSAPSSTTSSGGN
ncbi:MAG: hypothetical protein J2P57_01945, partial [Acidimicrobiaceae bacterium]|nr:hypothetical protein [Acidimicrobiaceae bacterium]